MTFFNFSRAARAAAGNAILAVMGIIIATGPARGAENADARARELVAKMTLAEKITELHGIQDSNHFRYVPPIARLGIPAFHIANGPAGLGPAGDNPQKPATALPSPIALASAWDPDLAKRYGVIIGREGKDLGEDLMEAPDINIARVPQNGRTFEAFGEDPYLVSRLAVAEIEGIQSQDVIANVKHYAANNQENNRMKVDAIVDERTLHEIYLPAFEASVKEGRVASLMAAYNKVNGLYCCENPVLLDQILKKDWGFNGFITSDFGAVHSTVPSALAGLDLEMPTGKYFGTNLEAAVENGQVPMSVIDDKLVRRFRTMMEYGLFDHPAKLQAIPARKDGAEARSLAEAGMVLLKNDGDLLPLEAKGIHRLALIGPVATNAVTGGGGSSHVVPLYTVSPLSGIQQRAGADVKVTLADGRNVAEAVALAKASEVAIVMAGDIETEGRDHALMLSGNQDELIAAVAAANPRTIVVLKTGSAVLMPWLGKVPALLEAWYPGEEDGNAVAAVLFGDVNPSGKLPITFPRSLADLPAHEAAQYPGARGKAQYSEGVFVGYRHYDAQKVEPLFPFGYGLSYTTFAYKNLAVALKAGASSEAAPSATVDLDVTNTGKRAGKAVVEVYVAFPSTAAVPQPPAQLKGFSTVTVKPGRTR
ncbi:MAG TPA: glycoside hydrolase family 3 C-terminal domain-containing protein, partial [Verrucomicrobiae bacterium]|nr:glycoside hydrolase family 3 C-terminal domain-containing protein [Verrucomicrobiae bacterium]